VLSNVIIAAAYRRRDLDRYITRRTLGAVRDGSMPEFGIGTRHQE
jgi:hypothetical protein